MRARPMIALSDVEGGSAWFQSVLKLTSAHGGPDYEMLMNGNDLVLQLHQWDAHEHPHLGDKGNPSRGNGVLLWFKTEDFDGLLSRIEAHEVEVLDGPMFNSNAQHREVWMRGPEGYVVVVAGPSAHD